MIETIFEYLLHIFAFIGMVETLIILIVMKIIKEDRKDDTETQG